MMEIDPGVQTTLAQLEQLRDGFPLATRRRTETWIYGKGEPGASNGPPICPVSIERPTDSGSKTTVRLEAGLVTEIVDPNSDQVLRQLATLLKQDAGGVARVRTPIVRDGDPMVGSAEMAGRLTALGLAGRRMPTAPETMTMVSDHRLWIDGRDTITLRDQKNGATHDVVATRVRRCEADVLGQKVKLSTFWLDNTTGALLRREIDMPGVFNPFTGRCTTLPGFAGSPASLGMGGSNLAAISVQAPSPPARTTSAARQHRR
jgi:hypothetical protein